MSMPSITESADHADTFETRSVWDPQSSCTIVVSTPAESPELWESFLAGARAGYRKYGAEKALEYERIRDGASTALFFAAVQGQGEVVGGVRAQGPYTSVDQAHATIEWSGHPGEATVRRMIADRLPFGVVEMKSAWVADAAARRKALTLTLARIGSYTLDLLPVQFLLATAAAHVIDLWKTSGGIVAEEVPAAPYPDDRYQTKLMWWDRRRDRSHADRAELQRLLITSPSAVQVRSFRNRHRSLAGSVS